MNRKEAILKAAVQLFAERGFHATPTSEVAKRARVAEGTIFHHFRSKEEILMCLFEGIMNNYIRGVEQITKASVDGLSAVEGFVRFHLRFSDENADELKVVMRDFPSNLTELGSPFRAKVIARLSGILDLLKRCIEMGQRDGSIRFVPAEEAALIVQGMLVGLSRIKLMGPMEVPDISTQVVDFCRRGLQSEKASAGKRR